VIVDLTGSYDRAWQIGTLISFAAGVIQIVAGGPPRRTEGVGIPAMGPT
jgi:hypothetical protein